MTIVDAEQLGGTMMDQLAELFDEEIGGGGLDYATLAWFHRELGRTSYALHSWISQPTEILLACEGDQVEHYLNACVRAEKRECFALTEPGAGSDVAAMRSTARKSALYRAWSRLTMTASVTRGK